MDLGLCQRRVRVCDTLIGQVTDVSYYSPDLYINMKSYERKKCGRFIEYSDHRKKFILYIAEYFMDLGIT